MSISYRNLISEDDFQQCVDLQKSIFGLTDTDVISPLLLKLLARDFPSIGISIGLFNNSNEKSELIGYMIGYATFLERSIYGATIGIKKEYRNKENGFILFLKFREFSLKKGIECMYGVFEPLESNLAHLYFTNLGFTFIKYEKDALINDEHLKLHYIPTDKVLIKWDYKSKKTSR